MGATSQRLRTTLGSLRRSLAGDARSTVAALGVLALIALGFLWSRARDQAKIVASLREMGGKVTYSCDLPFASTTWPPGWLRGWLGKDFCDDLVGIDLSGKPIDDATLGLVSRLTSLRYLLLGNTTIGDDGLARLSGLTQLEELTLSRTSISDTGLGHLSKCQSLRLIHLEGTDISDDGLMQLVRLPNLTAVFAMETHVSPEGVEFFHDKAPSVLLQIHRGRWPPRRS
jgi:hypothetical protein